MVRKFPSIIILVCIVVGIALADQSRLPSWVWLAMGTVSTMAGLLRMHHPDSRLTTVLFGLSLLFLSAFSYNIRYREPGPNHLANQVDARQQYHIFGTVSDWPDLKSDRTELKIEIDSLVTRRTQIVNGAILLRISDTTTSLQRGDRLEFTGRIYPLQSTGSSATFDYRRYLNLKGVFGIVYLPTLLDVRIDKGNHYSVFPLVDNLRNKIREYLYTDLSPSSAAMATGFLIGETRNIPTEVYQRFRDSGTLHLLAVSGSNVAIVLLFFLVLMRPLSLTAGRRAAVLVSIIVLFTLLSYEEPSVVRASIMAMMVITAGLLQRRYSLNNIIAATAVIILLFDPAQLFDVGFQLSFVTAWGLIIVLPVMADFFKPVRNRWWYRWLVFPLMVSVVAQICSMGIIVYYFGRVPLISPLANLVIVPLVSVAVVGVLVLLLAHFILPLLGAFFGSFLNLLLTLIAVLVQHLGGESMPSATVSNAPLWGVLCFYGFLLLAIWSVSRKAVRRVFAYASLIMVNVLLLAGVVNSSASIGDPKITLFTIPGGVVATVSSIGCDEADMIVSGIHGRNYPVDSRIIQPQLKALGVGSIRNLFVLTAAYDGLDDLLRLSDEYRVKRIFVSKKHSAGFREVLGRMENPMTGMEVVTFSNLSTGGCTRPPCYRPCENGISIDLDQVEIVVCDKLLPGRFEQAGERPKRILVIGKSWYLSPEMLARLRSEGFGAVFCSKIEQRNSPSTADNFPIEVQDLSVTGTLSLSL